MFDNQNPFIKQVPEKVHKRSVDESVYHATGNGIIDERLNEEFNKRQETEPEPIQRLKGKELSPEEKEKWDTYADSIDDGPYHKFDETKYIPGDRKSNDYRKQLINKIVRGAEEGKLTNRDKADEQLAEAIGSDHGKIPMSDPNVKARSEKIEIGFRDLLQKGIKKPDRPDRAVIREMLHYQPESSKESLLSRFGTVVPSEIEKQIQEGILRGEFQEVPENFDEIAFEDPDFGQKLAQEEYEKKQQDEAVDHEATRKWLEDESEWMNPSKDIAA